MKRRKVAAYRLGIEERAAVQTVQAAGFDVLIELHTANTYEADPVLVIIAVERDEPDAAKLAGSGL